MCEIRIKIKIQNTLVHVRLGMFQGKVDTPTRFAQGADPLCPGTWAKRIMSPLFFIMVHWYTGASVLITTLNSLP